MLGLNETYETQRCYLLRQTAGFRRLVQKIRKDHGLENITVTKRRNKLMFASLINDNLGVNIVEYAKALQIHPEFLEDCISGYVRELPERNVLPIYVSTGYDPIPDGFYIRVFNYTKRKTVNDAFDAIKKEQKHLSETAENKVKVAIEDKKLKKEWVRRSRLFVDIETNIYSQLQDKEQGYLNSNENEEHYFKRIIEDSIETATLEIVGNDDDKSIKFVKNIYYDTLDHFNILPFKKFTHEIELTVKEVADKRLLKSN